MRRNTKSRTDVNFNFSHYFPIRLLRLRSWPSSPLSEYQFRNDKIGMYLLAVTSTAHNAASAENKAPKLLAAEAFFMSFANCSSLSKPLLILTVADHPQNPAEMALKTAAKIVMKSILVIYRGYLSSFPSDPAGRLRQVAHFIREPATCRPS